MDTIQMDITRMGIIQMDIIRMDTIQMGIIEVSKRVLCYQKDGGLGDFFLALPSMLAFQELHPMSVYCVPDPLFNFFKEINQLKNIVPLSDVDREISQSDIYDYTIDFANVMIIGDSEHPYLKRLEFESFNAGIGKHASDHYFEGLIKIEPELSKKDFSNFQKMPLFEYEVEEQFYKDRGVEPFNYFTLHAGAGFPLKVWEKRNFENTIELLLDKYPDYMCVVIEGPDDPILSFEERYNSRIVVAKEPLENVAKLFSGSLFHIDNDSGVHHLAGVLDIPTITIFGPTGPGTWKSLTDKNFILWGWNNCNKPCDYMSVRSCSDKVCLTSIKPDDVVKLVPKILELYL